MTYPVRILMFADLACPFAYLTAYRLRRVSAEFRGRVVVEHRCLSLEYVNREPTPKPLLDLELPLLLAVEPTIPYRPWAERDSTWPVTLLPAFEAVKCAERQSWELADELAWAIRVAFFGENRCVSLRHIVLDLASQVGLDLARFVADFDGGIAKRQVIDEARDGWETRGIPGSPTLVLPNGNFFTDLGLPEFDFDAESYYRPVVIAPASCTGPACDERYRRLFMTALATGGGGA